MRTRTVLLAIALGCLAVRSPARAEPPAACVCPEGRTDAPQVVDLNTADETALLTLPGIGPARAAAIVAYRRAHGGFRSISQLLHIKGIGRAMLKRLRPLVTLSTSAS